LRSRRRGGALGAGEGQWNAAAAPGGEAGHTGSDARSAARRPVRSEPQGRAHHYHRRAAGVDGLHDLGVVAPNRQSRTVLRGARRQVGAGRPGARRARQRRPARPQASVFTTWARGRACRRPDSPCR
jgi:hypothetical protein